MIRDNELVVENSINFFDRKLSKEEWDSPTFLQFANMEIPANKVNLEFNADNKTLEYYRKLFNLPKPN